EISTNGKCLPRIPSHQAIATMLGQVNNRPYTIDVGKAVRLFLWSDLPSVYCAMGALFKVRGPKGVRKIPYDEFYAAQPLGILKRCEYLEEIIVPDAGPRSGGAFDKFSETSNTFALASATACVTLTGSGKCSSARLVIGGLQLLPRVSREASRLLEGQVPSAGLIREAAAAAVGELKAVKDTRVSDEYKRELAGTIAGRALEGAFNKAGGKQ
ncbi:MAG: FAD binding domain-containing protein, partial [bacterium]